ncbi:VWA domain-containing protein [Xenophilus arseniciresistens]|uniref:VWA domain-containing protein n=1 Tax=Xenophilus arseniciresistens TaxID=1283306 RepID=A0AAE3T212_9BURK|nr:VWA domain-containing protein [Xenophilus arseniciresistens]MDA7418566.1 VWA domain-containing protein [Xenophilus arseniciresistens]
MGYGNYSYAAHTALVADRSANPGQEVFHQRGTHPLMNPHGLTVRESRDSVEHPQSLAIAFALDVTGSMGDIPRQLATRELPTFMKLLTDFGVADPQILFMAVGDANSDRAALQVGQFETTAELMDQWLTRSYLESGGGGSGEESYELAFYTLAQHTDIDCHVKRHKRGYLFMTGDELPYSAVSRHQVEALFGEKLDEDIPIEEVIAAAQESYHLFFLIPDAQRRKNCEARWRELLGDQVICMGSPEDACVVAAALVALTEKAAPDLDALAHAMSGHGVPRERVGRVVLAIDDYAASLVPGAPRRPRQLAPAGSAPARSGWWKRLFG